MRVTKSQAPDAEVISAARQKIETAISDGMKEAEASGKKLVVVLGENHGSRDSMLLEVISLDIAQKHGVRNLAIEQTQESLELRDKTGLYEVLC